MRSVPETGADTTATVYQIQATADGWTFLLPDRDPIEAAVTTSGDSIITEVEQLGQKGNFGKVKAVARVDGEIVAECVILYSVVDSPARETEGEELGRRILSPSQP